MNADDIAKTAGESADWIEQLISACVTHLQQWLPTVLWALTLLVLGWIGVRFITAMFKSVMRRAKVDDTVGQFLGSLVRIGLLTIVIISALDVVGVETTSFAAVLAAAGLAVGMALQGSLGNLASGVMLIIFRPFAKGDYVSAGGVEGVVDEVAIFATTLKSPDNKTIIVPNAAIAGNAIINFSRQPKRRVDMVFGIGYGDDLKKAKQVLTEIVSGHPKVLKEPAPQIAVGELADSSVNFVTRPWVTTADYWDVYFDLQEQVKLRFDEEGISIPFPQQDVHMHTVT